MATIQETTLRELVDAGAVRALRAVQSADGSWALVAQVGMAERTLRSAREPVRTWRRLDTMYRWTRQTLGVNRLELQGQ